MFDTNTCSTCRFYEEGEDGDSTGWCRRWLETHKKTMEGCILYKNRDTDTEMSPAYSLGQSHKTTP